MYVKKIKFSLFLFFFILQSCARWEPVIDPRVSKDPEEVTRDILECRELTKDIEAGMYFDSSIPQGYGVGSSGALVAAIYDKYTKNKITVLENSFNRSFVILTKSTQGARKAFTSSKRTSSSTYDICSFTSLTFSLCFFPRWSEIII